MATDVPTFHWADYVLFSAMLAISAAIGVFYAIRDRRQFRKSPDNLLTGNKKLPVLPVALSLLATIVSAVFIIGTPAEVYVNGGIYWIIGFSFVTTGVIFGVFFLPILYALKMTSAYEYLELRFNSTVRLMGSMTFTILMVVYMGVALFAPALALSQVTGLSMEISILALGLVCTFYTSIGGIKAVIWTDVFQVLIVIAGVLALVIQGVISVGGWNVVFDRARQGDRMPYFEWNPDPFVRHTFWSLLVGGTFTFMGLTTANQSVVQRFINIRTLNGARCAVGINVILSALLLCITCLTGLVLYAQYHDCDPLLSGKILKMDQIVPFFMMQTLGFLPGLPGLFVACVFGAALSTVSSGINALAAVTLVDFVKPILDRMMSTRPTARLLSVLAVIIAVLFGLVTIGVAYLAGVVGSTILQIALSLFGMIGGPLFGLFAVGVFAPCINSWGAGAGLISSLAISLWAGVGAVVNPVPRNRLLLSTVGCEGNITANLTRVSMTTSTTNLIQTANVTLPATLPDSDPLQHWYSLSYLHYSTLSLLVTFVVGLLVSAATGFNRKCKLDPRTYFDIWNCCKRCFVESKGFDLTDTYIEEGLYLKTIDGEKQNGCENTSFEKY